MDCSTPGLPVYHQLPEFTQTHVHRVGDIIQPSHPLSPSPPAFNLSQHQGLLQWVRAAWYLSLNTLRVFPWGSECVLFQKAVQGIWLMTERWRWVPISKAFPQFQCPVMAVWGKWHLLSWSIGNVAGEYQEHLEQDFAISPRLEFYLIFHYSKTTSMNLQIIMLREKKLTPKGYMLWPLPFI